MNRDGTQLAFMRPIPWDEIPSVWPFVEHGLNVILARTRETWTSQDVYRHLRFGKAQLFMHDKGFVTLEKCQEPISGEPYLNLWHIFFLPGEAKKLRPELIAWVDEMRMATRCEWIQGSSPREAWDVLEPDFEKVRTVWRRK